MMMMAVAEGAELEQQPRVPERMFHSRDSTRMRPGESESKSSSVAVQEALEAAIHSERSTIPGVLCELHQPKLSRLIEQYPDGMSSKTLSNEDSDPPRGAALLEIQFHLDRSIDALDVPLIKSDLSHE